MKSFNVDMQNLGEGRLLEQISLGSAGATWIPWGQQLQMTSEFCRTNRLLTRVCSRRFWYHYSFTWQLQTPSLIFGIRSLLTSIEWIFKKEDMRTVLLDPLLELEKSTYANTIFLYVTEYGKQQKYLLTRTCNMYASRENSANNDLYGVIW